MNIDRNKLIEILEYKSPKIYKEYKNYGLFDNPSENLQLRCVNRKPYFLLFIKDPNDKVILKALSKDMSLIRYIDNQTDKIHEKLFEYLDTDPQYIKYFKNPDEAMQLKLIDNYFRYLEYFNCVFTEKAQLKIVEFDSFGHTARYLKEPTRTVMMKYIKKNYNTIEYFDQDEELQLYALDINPDMRYFEDPSDKVIMKALTLNGANIRRIDKDKRTHEMYNVALKTYASLIIDIPNPTKEMYMQAIKTDYNMLRYLHKNVITYDMCLEAVKLNGEAILCIPDEFITEEIQMIAFKNNHSKEIIDLCNSMKDEFEIIRNIII